MTAQGHARSVFNRAIERRNLLIAELTVREIGQVSLAEALALTVLIGERAPERLERVASRWLRLYLDERPDASASETGFVAAALRALGNDRTREPAARALAALISSP